MEMPRPGREQERLKSLAGKWTGEETMHPSPWDPQGGPATSTMDSSIDVDGFYLISRYAQSRGGQVCYRGHGVIGYNAQEKCYEMWWFDSTGMTSPAPARGKWEGDTLMFEQQSPMGFSRSTYTLKGDGRYAFGIAHSQDGKQWTSFMDGSYTRT